MTRSIELIESDRALILFSLNESYVGPAWHGPSVREALAGVTASVAAKRLAAGRNSVHELVLHLAHGRHLLIERVTAAPPREFPRPIREPWWPVAPADVSNATWRADLELLDDYHRMLMEAVRQATPKQLERVPERSDHTIAQQLLGMALHDTYHAGQIRLLALELADREPPH